jgi:hypothetical protein
MSCCSCGKDVTIVINNGGWFNSLTNTCSSCSTVSTACTSCQDECDPTCPGMFNSECVVYNGEDFLEFDNTNNILTSTNLNTVLESIINAITDLYNQPALTFNCTMLNTCSINSLSDVDTSTVVPVTNDLLVYNGTNWVANNPNYLKTKVYKVKSSGGDITQSQFVTNINGVSGVTLLPAPGANKVLNVLGIKVFVTADVSNFYTNTSKLIFAIDTVNNEIIGETRINLVTADGFKNSLFYLYESVTTGSSARTGINKALKIYAPASNVSVTGSPEIIFLINYNIIDLS